MDGVVVYIHTKYVVVYIRIRRKEGARFTLTTYYELHSSNPRLQGKKGSGVISEPEAKGTLRFPGLHVCVENPWDLWKKKARLGVVGVTPAGVIGYVTVHGTRTP